MMPYYAETHWFQDLNAFVLLLDAVLCSMASETKNKIWLLASSFFLILSIDEYFVLHECLKVSIFRGLHFSHLQDYVILCYGLVSVCGGLYLVFKEANDKFDWIILSVSMLLVGMILAIDVFALFGDHAVEEIAEMVLSILFSIYVFRRAGLTWSKLLKWMIPHVCIFLISGYVIGTFLHNTCKLPKSLTEKALILRMKQ